MVSTLYGIGSFADGFTKTYLAMMRMSMHDKIYGIREAQMLGEMGYGPEADKIMGRLGFGPRTPPGGDWIHPHLGADGAAGGKDVVSRLIQRESGGDSTKDGP